MKKVFTNLVLLGVVAALSGCAGTPLTTGGIVAPTTSSAVAPVAQKNDVVAWSSACDGWDNLKTNLAIFTANGKVPYSAFPKIRTALSVVDPLCTSFPVNTTAATQTVISTGLQLMSVVPGLSTTQIVGALAAPAAPTTSATTAAK